MPISFVHLSGSSRPAIGASTRRASTRDGARRRVTPGGGAAQRVRQKTSRSKRRFGDGASKVVERTCVGCNTTGDASELLRVVYTPEVVEIDPTAAPVLVDLGGKLNGGRHAGRGAWVHSRRACIERACSKGFSRAFSAHVRVSADALTAQINEAATRRLAGLLMASFRSRQLVYGRDAVKEVLSEAPLVILAKDAQSVAKDGDLQRAGAQGKVVFWSTKEQLGQWLGRPEVGVVALTDGAIADVVRRTIALSELSREADQSRVVEEAQASQELGADAVADGQELKGTAGLMSSAELSSAGTNDGAGLDEELSEVR